MLSSQIRAYSILYLSFNQDQTCISCGLEYGFKIYSVFPFQETFSRDLAGGIGIVEMLYQCNIVALVGGGKEPKYSPNKLILWDDSQTKIVAEMSFKSDIKAVKLKQSRIIIILENKIFVYNFSDLKIVDHIETFPNLKGLCAINNIPDDIILACPSKRQDLNKKTNIKAHQTPISLLELNIKGNRLATASEKGTLIKIFDTESGITLQELRRGSEYALLHSIAFDFSGKWICCSSDSGTIHIFSLKPTEKEKTETSIELPSKTLNPKSKFEFLKVLFPYFDSEWSFAQFRMPDVRSIVSFGNENNTIVAVTYEGNYYYARFDSINGGECLKQQQNKLFIDLD